jgi:outer membrane protein assembly factor BamA
MFKTIRILVVSLLLGGSSLSAQEESSEETKPASTRQEELRRTREEKAKNLEPYEVSSTESRIRGLEKIKFPQNIFVKGWRGFRPVIGGMPSGSGTVFGGGYVHGLENQYFLSQANARYSTKGYTTADAEIIYPTPQEKRRFEIKGRTEYRDLTSLRFFGIGNDTSKDDRATYLLNDRSAYSYFWLNPRGLLSFGAEVGWYSAETGPGDDDDSAETLFEPREIPGFGTPRNDYGVAGGWVEFDIRDKWEEPPVGIEARVTALRFEDLDENNFDFTRIIADIKGYIPLGYRSRILAFRFRTSHSDRESGSLVPFYLMETIGGAQTIRGFDEFRFRDRRNFVLSVEYRWEIWAFVDMTVFVDTGKVFSGMDDFNLKDLHTGYGFGLRIHTPGGFRLRFDVARSVEGVKFHINAGPSF